MESGPAGAEHVNGISFGAHSHRIRWLAALILAGADVVVGVRDTSVESRCGRRTRELHYGAGSSHSRE